MVNGEGKEKEKKEGFIGRGETGRRRGNCRNVFAWTQLKVREERGEGEGSSEGRLARGTLREGEGREGEEEEAGGCGSGRGRVKFSFRVI